MDKRNTKQKQAIRDAFQEANRPLSPEEALHYALKHHSTIGIATIYRNIQALVEDGWLAPVAMPGDSTRYEIAGKGHHHHFQCNACGKVFDLKGCNAPPRPRLPQGFSTTSHEFFLYGNCSSCNTGSRSAI